MPGLGVAGVVFEGEGEDGVAFFDGVGTFGGGGLEGAVDSIEGEGGGEGICGGGRERERS